MAKIQTIEIVDIENVRNEKLRYQKNTLAYFLGFGGIIFSVVAAFIELNTMKPNYLTMFYILLNIVILLFGFLSCENIKGYRKGYAFVMFAFAGVNVLRMFGYPLTFITKWNKYKGDNLHLSKYYSEQVYLADVTRKGFLPQNGIFRGVLCIFLLVISAVFFSFAGYVGYHKAHKLEKYLSTINVDIKKR